MTDPLNLLRKFNANKNPIVEKNDLIIFGEYSWPKTAKTRYLVKGSGKGGNPKQYYTLECLLFFLRNVHVHHVTYVKQAAAKNIPPVRRPDRKDLLSYLNGYISSSANIDESAVIQEPTAVKIKQEQIQEEGAKQRGVKIYNFKEKDNVSASSVLHQSNEDPYSLPATPRFRPSPSQNLAGSPSNHEVSSNSKLLQTIKVEKEPFSSPSTPRFPISSSESLSAGNTLNSSNTECLQTIKIKKDPVSLPSTLGPKQTSSLTPSGNLAVDIVCNLEAPDPSELLPQSVKIEKDSFSLPPTPRFPLSPNESLTEDNPSNHKASSPSELFPSVKVENDPFSLPPTPPNIYLSRSLDEDDPFSLPPAPNISQGNEILIQNLAADNPSNHKAFFSSPKELPFAQSKATLPPVQPSKDTFRNNKKKRYSHQTKKKRKLLLAMHACEDALKKSKEKCRNSSAADSSLPPTPPNIYLSRSLDEDDPSNHPFSLPPAPNISQGNEILSQNLAADNPSNHKASFSSPKELPFAQSKATLPHVQPSKDTFRNNKKKRYSHQTKKKRKLLLAMHAYEDALKKSKEKCRNSSAADSSNADVNETFGRYVDLKLGEIKNAGVRNKCKIEIIHILEAFRKR